MKPFATLRALTLIPLIGLGACSGTEPTTALLPQGALAIAAPASYTEWYSRTESCAATQGDFAKLRFFVVPGVRTFQSEFGETVALWRKVGDEQFIIVSGEYSNDEMVVRHEMLHALLQREGHPAEFFVNRCRLTWDTWGQSAFASAGGGHPGHTY
ncbi:MAG: hypothetical protein SFW67_29705 [Myxococcaceae bacterium]|nr:hypothetical protein [Myxococcaceae bacterium]